MPSSTRRRYSSPTWEAAASGPSRHNIPIDGLESNDVTLLHGELLFRGEFPAALTFINGTALGVCAVERRGLLEGWLGGERSRRRRSPGQESAPWNGADSWRVGWAVSGAAGDALRARDSREGRMPRAEPRGNGCGAGPARNAAIPARNAGPRASVVRARPGPPPRGPAARPASRRSTPAEPLPQETAAPDSVRCGGLPARPAPGPPWCIPPRRAPP